MVFKFEKSPDCTFVINLLKSNAVLSCASCDGEGAGDAEEGAEGVAVVGELARELVLQRELEFLVLLPPIAWRVEGSRQISRYVDFL